jgi:hypothetical protein
MDSTTTVSAPPSSIVGSIVDADRYPLDNLDGSTMSRVVDTARASLEAVGCARLASFVRPEAHAALEAETDAVAHLAYKNSQEITPYADFGDDTWPADHPRRHVGWMTNGFVGRDLIPTDAMIQQIYTDPAFQAFIALCLGVDELHVFADPIRGLVVNVMDDDERMPWHFDANEFIVSLMTKRPEAGGQFEYCPDLRVPGDERYDHVQRVLDGDHSPVRELTLEVGDLQIFRGRYSMHRITPVTGSRHTVLFGYSETPGYIGGVESTRIGYGRVTQTHLDAEAAGRHTDGLAG